MNDAEISRKLALAIGYAPEDLMQNLDGGISVRRSESPQGYAVPGWYRFDYRDGETIWPIVERFNCSPRLDQYQRWVAGKYPYIYADTAAKAVALAVIKAH